MSDIDAAPDHKTPGEPGEHPLSVLLFSWMRGKVFLRVFIGLMVLAGLASVGLEIWLSQKPVKDVTSAPGFYAVFGFIAFAIVALSAWPMGKLLRRREDYYDARGGEAGRDR